MKKLRAICFYLPQFHPTDFNDKNWGPGFTEWTNVARGRPRFLGHYQPKIPGELGFYDLRRRDIFRHQVQLANSYGIYGFCFYYYRFGSDRELDKPITSLLSRPVPFVPFLYCWANESWTRAWDGRSDDVIRSQTYDDATINGVIDDLVFATKDERYIRIDGRPVFLIYQLEHMPSPLNDWLSDFRTRVRTKIGCDILLGAVYSHGFTTQMASIVDFVVQFPPHRIPRTLKRTLIDAKDIDPYDPSLEDYFESYDSIVRASLEGLDLIPNMAPGICPDWDNSARRSRKAHIVVGSTPDKFMNWTREAGRRAIQRADDNQIPYPLLFVNAWNEWAEGAVLEPTWDQGRSYLEAIRDGMREAQGTS